MNIEANIPGTVDLEPNSGSNCAPLVPCRGILARGITGSMNARDPQNPANDAATQAIPAIVSTLIDNAVAALDADPGRSRSYLLRASVLLRACSTRERQHRPNPRLRGLALWQLNRIIDHIEQHLTERITGKELAQLVGVSIGQLFRAFKLSVGLPPQHYVVARRLQFACSLLRTSREPLSQIALTAGFCDQAHFCRVFRRVLGVTPAAWRQINATGPGRYARANSVTPIQANTTFVL